LISNKRKKKPLIPNVCCGAHGLKALIFVFLSSHNKRVIDLTKHDGLRFANVIKKKTPIKLGFIGCKIPLG
jgi:hypothetical protein